VTYCIDTSALMDAWHRWYPPEVFISLWQYVEQLVDDGRLFTSEEVLRELERKSDELHNWIKIRKSACLPLTDLIQERVSDILLEFPKLVDSRTGKSFADPFVIATASVHWATVVTGEKPTGSRDRPKIPDVCSHLEIECISIVDLIRREKWTF